ncbi:hypothetical protein [Bacillus sp. NPDC077027]|uniref:hypothetical protein n=1 Tax=Bacillus sp. NPDC077027 TaxID=3390548 RepID=UPI003D09072F
MKKFLSKSLSSVVFFALAIILTFTTVAPGQAQAATFKGIPFEQQEAIKNLLEKNGRVINILISSFVEEDNSYTFDVNKAIELGLTEEEAATAEKFLDRAAVLTIVFSESITKNEKGKLEFDAKKAVELGLTEDEAAKFEKLFKSVFKIVDLVSDALVLDKKGNVVIDSKVAKSLGFSSTELLVVNQLLKKIPQEQLKMAYDAIQIAKEKLN